MGAEVWHRDDFLDTLEIAMERPTKKGSWSIQFEQWLGSSTNNNL
jgi:hypothetical protein